MLTVLKFGSLIFLEPSGPVQAYNVIYFCFTTRYDILLYNVTSCLFVAVRGGAFGWLGSIPDGFTGIFHLFNFSGRTVALESTLILTEMSTRDIS